MVVKTVVEAQDIFDKAWEGFKGVDWKEVSLFFKKAQVAPRIRIVVGLSFIKSIFRCYVLLCHGLFVQQLHQVDNAGHTVCLRKRYGWFGLLPHLM